MTLYTKSIAKPRVKLDGYRICIMRNPRDYRDKSLYEEWMPILAPTQELRDKVKNGMKWEEFKSEFLSYLSINKEAKESIEEVAKRAAMSDITLLCVEDSPERCHRSLVAEVIKISYPNLRVVIQ